MINSNNNNDPIKINKVYIFVTQKNHDSGTIYPYFFQFSNYLRYF
jgi:hypothetical protein